MKSRVRTHGPPPARHASYIPQLFLRAFLRRLASSFKFRRPMERLNAMAGEKKKRACEGSSGTCIALDRKFPTAESCKKSFPFRLANLLRISLRPYTRYMLYPCHPHESYDPNNATSSNDTRARSELTAPPGPQILPLLRLSV